MITAASSQIANAQADAAIRTNDRFQDSAQESTREIAQQLDNNYTRAAQANLTGAQAGIDQVGAAQTGLGQLRDQYAAQGQDPAMRRLNDMAAGQLYRPDQIRAGQVAADQVQGARVADIGPMQAARLGQVANVQGPAGYAPDQVRAQQVQAASVAPTQDVQSRNIRSSAAERGLMNEARGGGLLGQLENQASSDLALGRSLSAEQSRDAIQSARAGMAARGLGVGNSALAAEMLNRDRFATQRQNERRAFASGILNQGTGIRQTANQAYLARQDMNTGRQLQADLANQQTGLALGQANAQLEQQANLANQSTALQAGQLNQSANARAAEFQQQGGLQANLANQQTALSLGLAQGQMDQQANAATFESAQQRAMADAGYSQQANLANQTANLNAAQYNVGQDMAAQQANQQANQTQEQYNRAFLGQVAGMNFDQNQARTSMLSGLYGQQAGLGQTTAALQQGMAQSQIGLDPYSRALGSNMPIATIAPSTGLIGQAYGQSMNYGSDLFNTNTNMQASMYNTFQNNQAGLRAARIGGASGLGAWGTVAEVGGTVVGAALKAYTSCWVARAAWGEDNPRWVEFRDNMLAYAPDWFVRFYLTYGPSIAKHINTPLRRAITRNILTTLQNLWTPKTQLQPA